MKERSELELKERAQENKRARLGGELKIISGSEQKFPERVIFDSMDDEGIVAISAR